MSASSAGDVLGRQPVAEVAAGQREDRPPVGQPQRGDPLRGRRPARPCPAAPPTAGRRGRRRRRPAVCLARAPWAGRAARRCRRRRRPAPSSRRGWAARWSARPELAPSTASSRLRSSAEPRSRASSAAAAPPVASAPSSASTSRCSERTARSGSPARASAATTGPASGSAGSLRSRSHSPSGGVGEQPGGALAVLEAEPDQPDDGPPRDLRRASPPARSCGLAGAGRGRGRRTGRRTAPTPPRGRGARRRSRRQSVSRSYGLAATPTVSRSAHSRDDLRRRLDVELQPVDVPPDPEGLVRRSSGLLASSVAPVGSSAISSWCNWITSGESGSGPNTGSRVGGVPLGHQRGAHLGPVDARAHPSRRRRRPAAARRGRWPASGTSAATAWRSSSRTPTSSGLTSGGSSADCGPPSTTSPS